MNVKHLNYSIEGMLDIYKDCDIAKSKHKSLHKVAEDKYLNWGEIIYLYIS